MYRAAMAKNTQVAQQIVVGLLRLYRYLVSPILGAHCRFTPTCSVYAETAVMRYGIMRGGCLAIRRILKCHPFHEGGIDEVPEKK